VVWQWCCTDVVVIGLCFGSACMVLQRRQKRPGHHGLSGRMCTQELLRSVPAPHAGHTLCVSQSTQLPPQKLTEPILLLRACHPAGPNHHRDGGQLLRRVHRGAGALRGGRRPVHGLAHQESRQVLPGERRPARLGSLIKNESRCRSGRRPVFWAAHQ